MRNLNLPIEIQHKIIEIYAFDKKSTIKSITKQLESLNVKRWQVHDVLTDSVNSGIIKWHRNYMDDLSAQDKQDILDKFDNGVSIKDLVKEYKINSIGKFIKETGRVPVRNDTKYDHLRAIPLTDVQKQITIGMLLGDGCSSYYSDEGNYKISFGHCEQQFEYFLWLYESMQPFMPSGYKRREDKRKNSVMYGTRSVVHEDFTAIGKPFYIDGPNIGLKKNGKPKRNRIKIVPDNLHQYMTPILLAVWIMDDGSLNEDCNMRISTHGFSQQDNVKLKNYLWQCFGLVAEIKKTKKKGYYWLWLNKENTKKLSDIIRPHVVDSMKYKIMPEYAKKFRNLRDGIKNEEIKEIALKRINGMKLKQIKKDHNFRSSTIRLILKIAKEKGLI